MIKTLKIVTDTSCCFSPQEIEKYGIMVIPVNVQIGKEIVHENISYDLSSLAHRISAERITPRVLYPSIDEFFKTYSLVFPKYHHVLSIHMSSRIAKIVEQAKNAQALLYDAKIDVLDCPLSENGLKPLILKAASLASLGDVPRHMILNTLNTFASKFHNYIVSDNQRFIKTNTNYHAGFGLSFSLSSSKKKYIFSATGGDLFLVDHYPNHIIIDKLSRLIEAASKGSIMYGRILYSLDEEFATNLAEVLKSRFDFVIKSMEPMSLSSLCRYGAHSTSVGFSFDEEYFAEYCPFEEATV